ncbi:DAK2 domain-containing protein [Salimicrobium sp. PL1-032A]|uniref:DAK2 domain-containing protein n=1 Tax=Salimicrobium sp. PL1-032A TaxID=3095364 RepID=UPI003261D3E7
MSLQELDGKTFAAMVVQGSRYLSNNAQMIDALNVFPVPDGDTGTNMNLSMTSGQQEVKNVTTDHAGDVAKALAKGLLMGARGNSGVILSQLFRGFSKSLEHKTTITTVEYASAMKQGVETAYKAVMKPVEGTVLTVAREASEEAEKAAEEEKDFIPFLERVVKAAKKSLDHTPELLPVLKEVGVVDSGGQGFLTIYEGFLSNLKGEEVPEADSGVSMDDMVSAEHHKLNQDFMDTADIHYGYCTEFMVKFEEDKLQETPYDEEAFREHLSEFGDSLLVVSDDELIRVHVHVEEPGRALSLGQQYGRLTNIKIENMREQHTSLVGEASSPSKEKSEYGIVTVAMGDGVKKLFESLGASVVIEGGQTMNPSTQDLSKAIEQAHANRVIILPNNKNIIMSAEQAAEIAEDQVTVVPSKTIPQGMSAMLGYSPESTMEENKQAMTSMMSDVKTGQVTYAVRDTSFNGMTIEKDHFMGIFDGDITVSNPERLDVAKGLLSEMIDEDDEILTIIYGEEVTEEELAEMKDYAEAEFEEMELEIHEGGQPIYSYIFSIE